MPSTGTLGLDRHARSVDQERPFTWWDQLTELGGVLGTVERIEGFSQIRSVGTIEGLDVIGFNNLEHVGNLDVCCSRPLCLKRPLRDGH